MERRYASNVSVSNDDLKYPIGKSIIAVNLPLKLLYVTVANANTESLKSLPILFDTYLDYMLAKFEPNRIVQKVKKIELLDKNPSSFKTIFDKELTP